MATIILSAVGSIFGGPIGGTIGAIIGREIDYMIFKPPAQEGPRLTELKITSSSYGMPVARQFGRMRAPGQIIWSTDLVEHKDKQSSGKHGPSVITYTYSASFAVALSSRPIRSVGRIWADGKLLRGASGDLKVGGTFRLHTGEGDQPQDALIAAAEGASRCPAYRGLAYAVFEDLQLSEYGNRIPTLSFEVIADNGALSLATLLEGTLDDLDAQLELTGIGGISAESSLNELLGTLDPLFPLDCDACDDRLILRPDRLQTATIALPPAATSTKREDFGGNEGFARKRTGESEQPVEVLRYYDIDRDYQPGAQRAIGRPLPGQPRSVDLPAAMTAAAARRLIGEAAKRAQWARQSLAWRVTELDPAVRPGAKVSVPGHPGLWRVAGWEWHDQGIDLTLTRLSPLAAVPFAADPGRANSAPDLLAPPTLLTACELPWDGNPGTSVPLLLAAVSSANAGWSGAALFVDQGDGALQLLGPTGRTRATIGTAHDVLGAASPLLFDRQRSVTIELAGEDLILTDATQRQLAMGANRALLGQEIIQFASALPLGNRRWKLSGLWRGRGGTELAVGLHQTGEDFVLLDGTGIALDPQTVGDAPATQIAAIGLGDTAPVTSTIALRGIGTRPLAPVHGQAAYGQDGSLQLTWTRRARGAWQWQDLAEVPLNEQVEAYFVTYGDGASVIASWDLASPHLTLTAAEFASLVSLVPAGEFTIRQRGDRGTSYALTLALP
ncbi:phage tail protein [Novosphingobium sp.]|uniref:GTA baseplate fiber-binding domain-containing protein n=1 Tax=Novosphingobium sp. TaxID=1874826 RepID=UPI0025DBC4BE|nr:phage tail protein [Novosphingobium sp.]MCC6926108.1 phage tail protein [Novosphingobium sp.]